MHLPGGLCFQRCIVIGWEFHLDEYRVGQPILWKKFPRIFIHFCETHVHSQFNDLLRIACCRFLIYVLFFQQRNRNRNNFMEISYVMKILRNFTIMWPKTQNTTPNTQHQQKKFTIWLASVIWQKKVMAEKKRSNIHVRVSLSLSFHVLSYFHIVRCF